MKKEIEKLQNQILYYKKAIEMVEEITYQGEVYEIIQKLKEQLNAGGKDV